MRRARLAAWVCVAAMGAGAADARAQDAPIAFDPAKAGQGTAVLVAADAAVLARDGRAGESLTIVLPRGTRVDPASREARCRSADAASGLCPDTSRIGFGRFGVTVRDFAPWGGETELMWSVAAFLGEPRRRGDPASVVLVSKLLGIDSVATLLPPALSAAAPASVTTTGRIVRRGSATEIRFERLPVRLDVPRPMTGVPSKLELSLTAVRRTRQDFVRRVRVRTLDGYETRRIRDHRLIGHPLFRAPERCGGSWLGELRVGGAGRARSTIACT